MNSISLKVGLIGFGTVGEGFYRLIQRLDYPHLQIKKIIVNDHNKERSLPSSNFSFNTDSVLNDPEIDLIIEAITDTNQAFHILKKALRNGKHVITASKKMVALYLSEIIDLQKETGQKVLYEAAVCGAIPVLQNLNNYFFYDKIKAVKGVFNGTANFILTQLEEGFSFEKALHQAQQKGLAEADPSSDIDGFDTQYKLVIAASHLFGEIVKPESVLRFGIRQLLPQDQLFSTKKGWKIRLIAEARFGDVPLVMPVLVSQNEYAYNLQGEDNFVELESESSGLQYLQGKGAGAFPTAQAILGDVEQLRMKEFYHYKNGASTERQKEAQKIEVYLRSPSSDIGHFFSEVYHRDYESGYYVTLGKIKVLDLKGIEPEKIAFIARLPKHDQIRNKESNEAQPGVFSPA